MKPEQGLRRAVIREWLALPHEQRQTKEQATAFAGKTAGAHRVSGGGDPVQIVLRWLLPRIGRA